MTELDEARDGETSPQILNARDESRTTCAVNAAEILEHAAHHLRVHA